MRDAARKPGCGGGATAEKHPESAPVRAELRPVPAINRDQFQAHDKLLPCKSLRRL